jgi:hypothetical protein
MFQHIGMIAGVKGVTVTQHEFGIRKLKVKRGAIVPRGTQRNQILTAEKFRIFGFVDLAEVGDLISVNALSTKNKSNLQT